MRTWLFLLAGLLVWTAHFFGVYIVASLFPGMELARWLTGLLTVAALALLAWLSLPVIRRLRSGEGDGDGLARWIDGISLLGSALAAVAVLYQGLPALTA